MGRDKGRIEATEDTAVALQGSGKPTGFEIIKKSLADTLHDFAVALGERASGQDSPFGISQCEKQASEWLDQSAEYAQQFDYEKANARALEYVKQNPGQSLLIAGGIGLIIGAVLRRR